MNIQTIFKETSYIAHCVPLAIEPLGIVYLNDVLTWVITINSTHHDVHHKTISVAQLYDLFNAHSSYFPEVKETYEKEREAMLLRIQEFNENDRIEF